MSTILDRSPETSVEDGVAHLAEKRSNVLRERRSFLTNFSIAGAVAGVGALTGCSNDGPTTLAPIAGPSVLDVLNFALNLEYLEASFYLYVTTGTGLAAADMGTGPGAVTGGARVTFVNPVVASLATQLATHERQHVQFLRATITAVGGVPVAMPALNLAAGGTVNSDATFLAVARQLEAVGVSAYIGGAQFLTSSTAALNYAAQILDTEAQHAGFVRELCIALNVTSAAVDAQDQPPTSTRIFNTDAMTGLNPSRTTAQVLQIVYGAAGQSGVTSGGFYPSGLNGAIKIS